MDGKVRLVPLLGNAKIQPSEEINFAISIILGNRKDTEEMKCVLGSFFIHVHIHTYKYVYIYPSLLEYLRNFNFQNCVYNSSDNQMKY